MNHLKVSCRYQSSFPINISQEQDIFSHNQSITIKIRTLNIEQSITSYFIVHIQILLTSPIMTYIAIFFSVQLSIQNCVLHLIVTSAVSFKFLSFSLLTVAFWEGQTGYSVNVPNFYLIVFSQ